MVLDGSWFYVVIGGYWRFLLVHCGAWWFLVVFRGLGGSGLFLVVHVVFVGSMWFLVILAGSWWFFVVLCGSWWFLVVLGDIWSFFVVICGL